LGHKTLCEIASLWNGDSSENILEDLLKKTDMTQERYIV